MDYRTLGTVTTDKNGTVIWTITEPLQVVFDTAVANMAAQGQRSMGYIRPDDTYMSCMYRSPEEARCIAGGVMPDAFYDQTIENTTVESLASNYSAVNRRLVCDDRTRSLLIALQEAHDSDEATPEAFQLRLYRIAATFDLSPTAADAVTRWS